MSASTGVHGQLGAACNLHACRGREAWLPVSGRSSALSRAVIALGAPSRSACSRVVAQDRSAEASGGDPAIMMSFRASVPTRNLAGHHGASASANKLMGKLLATGATSAPISANLGLCRPKRVDVRQPLPILFPIVVWTRHASLRLKLRPVSDVSQRRPMCNNVNPAPESIFEPPLSL